MEVLEWVAVARGRVAAATALAVMEGSQARVEAAMAWVAREKARAEGVGRALVAQEAAEEVERVVGRADTRCMYRIRHSSARYTSFPTTFCSHHTRLDIEAAEAAEAAQVAAGVEAAGTVALAAASESAQMVAAPVGKAVANSAQARLAVVAAETAVMAAAALVGNQGT